MISGHEFIAALAGTELFRLDRGRRTKTGQQVLIKTPRHDPPRAADIAALRSEIEILTNLRIAGVLQPLAPELLHGHALLLPDPGGTPLASLIASPRADLDLAMAVGIQLATILGEMHRRGMLHNGIRPDAILCDAESRRAWLIDFSDASSGAAGVNVSPAHALSTGRLTYASPEQTGRMNRVPDYRSDFYSLGVVLYEVLTGAPPFRSGDALELIHSHIARTPRPPAEVNPAIPRLLSGIVMKLLAKTADERYQSALGLREDLEICAKAWAAHAGIADFPLGRRDIGDRFLISQKLYGREQEVALLVGSFDRVCQTRPAPSSMLLVAGYSGIGKTSLIHELYKPIVRQRGYFISGKFDQVVRNIPFGALIQAFRALVRQLLTESEARLAAWRGVLTEALGANGGVLAEVIPEIEYIIGEQPAPVALGATEALNRFQLMFQNFVAAIARPEHPLVVFLDDLQWADAATLSLLEPLLSSGDIQCLLLMGAYRDNEVDAAHPLSRTLGALESAGVELRRVALGPLRLPDLTELIRDTLHGETADVAPLAQLVQDKTGDNPFFVTQFLKTLAQEGYLTFDDLKGRWTYRIEDIASAPWTDNVIDLMTRKIQRLSGKTQHALTLAACIGNPFDQHTLAVVSEQSVATAADDLREAINEGLVLPAARPYDAANADAGDSAAPAYAFIHDRVQQSAYALIPPERKQSVHLTVGRLLLSRGAADQAEEKIFDIVHHLNLGLGLVTDEAERVAIARLNLIAGQKAKSSTAHEAALDYLRAGLSLLGDTWWQSCYELAFTLHLEAAESQYLCGNFDAAEIEFGLLLWRAATPLDKARVCRLRSVQYENMARYGDALASAREGLILFGIVFPDAIVEIEAALESEISAIQTLLGERSIASLIDLPVMTDPEIRMVMNILTDIWSSAYILGNPALARLISAKMVRLSLMHGNVEESAYGYVTHAITVGPVREDYQSAYEFGRLALAVNERFHDSRRRAKIHQQFHAHVNYWRQPWHTCIPYAKEACRSGLESGDFLYAAYGAGTETWSAILATQDLAQFVRDYSPNVALIRKLKNAGFADSLKIILNWVRALQGKTRAPLSLSDESIDESDYLATYRGNPFFTTFHSVARLHLCYVFGEYDQALQAARVARETVYQLAGTVWPLIFDFWHGLTLAANYARATEDERRTYLEEMERVRDSFAVLAANCPENFLCQLLLLSAEIERVSGRAETALELYEQAVQYAGETGMLQHQALANELSARFRLERGRTKAAALFLAEARACYAQWGATAKVEELERRYPDLPDREAARRTAWPVEAGAAAAQGVTDAGALDLFSVMKATQAIAGEIELEQLLARLMKIAIENAGAERGCLLLEQDGEAFVHAEGSLDSAAVQIHGGMPLADTQSLPASIVNYVRRTSEAIVLADAQSDDRYGNDAYIARRRPRSVMCVPVQMQGRLIGILYLENNMIQGAFTPERIQIMQVLSTEAAISLENAKLIAGLKQEIHERKEAQQALRQTADQLRFLNDLVEQTTQALAVVDFGGRFIRCNRAYEQLTGYSQGELRGMTFTELTPPRWREPEAEQMARLKRGEPVAYEKEYRRKDGTLLPVEVKADVYRDAAAEARYLYAFVTDITGRRQEQEMLCSITAGTAAVTGGDFFYSLVRSLAAALDMPYAFVTECRDRTRAHSLAFWKRDDFGENFEYKVADTPCGEVVSGQVCYYFDNLQKLFPLDADLVALDAESYLGVPMFNAEGRTIGHLAVLDVRPMADDARRLSLLKIFASRGGAELERLRADESLRLALSKVEQLKNELEAENVYLRRDLIANVSHDLRTPLASMRGYLDTLLMKEVTLTPEKRRAYLEIASRQCERLGTLITDLFELTKLDIRDAEIRAEPVELCELAQDIAQKFELAAEKKAVVLKIDMVPDTPSVRADIGLIERVLENLLRNALEHTVEGDEVHLSVVPVEQRVMVRVRDTGDGIPAADLPHIFERTYRGEKSRRPSGGGAGLGLAIVKRILELHGSEITVESKLMAGTCFSFSLPIYAAVQAPVQSGAG